MGGKRAIVGTIGIGLITRWSRLALISIAMAAGTANFPVMGQPVTAPTVIDTLPGTVSGMLRSDAPHVVGRLAFFVARDSTHGEELWVSDGTAGGTRMVKDIAIGSATSTIQFVAVSASFVYFNANDKVHGCELWRSDGTEAGTIMLGDLEPGPGGSCVVQARESLPNGNVVFIASTSQYGSELWVTDGTVAGTRILKDISAGGANTGFYNGPFVAGNHAFFYAIEDNNGSGYLWVTDGTEAGTLPLKSSQGSQFGMVGFAPFAVLDGKLVVHAYLDNGDRGVWLSDGTSNGTVRLTDTVMNGNVFRAISDFSPRCDGKLYFYPEFSNIWVTDGSPAGTQHLGVSGDPGALSDSICFKGVLYFAKSTASAGRELWRSDGTPAGTFMVADANPGNSNFAPGNFVSIGDKLLFTAATAANGAELWSTDGSVVTMVAELSPFVAGTSIGAMTSYGGIAYFSAQTSTTTAPSLWYSDGTAIGTRSVNSVWPAATATAPASLTLLNGVLLYTATSGSTGRELWTWPLTVRPMPMPSGSLQGMWWAVGGTESGWGLSFTHQADTIFVAWYTYGSDGKPWWLVSSAVRAADGAFAGDLLETAGPAFGTVPFDPGKVTGKKVGVVRLAFSDAHSGTFTYTVSGTTQAKPIAPLGFGAPVPTCAYQTAISASQATNYQDMWWVPGGAESGWGITFTHQGDTIFAAWYTYDTSGKPWWLVASAVRTADKTYVGQLVETAGPAFNAVPFDASRVTGQIVGSVTLAFTDGANGMLSYTVNGISQTKPLTRMVFGANSTVCQ